MNTPEYFVQAILLEMGSLYGTLQQFFVFSFHSPAFFVFVLLYFLSKLIQRHFLEKTCVTYNVFIYGRYQNQLTSWHRAGVGKLRLQNHMRLFEPPVVAPFGCKQRSIFRNHFWNN